MALAFDAHTGHRYEVEVRADAEAFSSRRWKAGSWTPVVRDRTVEGRRNTAVLDAVGLSQAQVDDMYRTLAIANYEDRYVIPTTHREYAENAFDLKSSCGFSFGQGCYDGRSVGNLFSALGPSAGRMAPPRVEDPVEPTQEGQR